MNKKQKYLVFFSLAFLPAIFLGANQVFAGSIQFTNPIAFTTFEGFLGSILAAIQRIVVTLALVFIVIGALFYLTSSGSSEMIEKGKKTITMAILGLAIGIGAPSILKELAGILGWGEGEVASNCNPGDEACVSIENALTLSEIAVNTLEFLLGIAGILAIIMLVIGGMMYLASGGDQERIETGKKIFKYSLMGTIITFASLVLVRQIALLFI